MSDLVGKQMQFSRMVPRLLLQAELLGIGVTLGDAYRDARCGYGHPKSLHKWRLAIDLNLWRGLEYVKDGDAEEYRQLGRYWESIGGSWGGRWGDANHFSLAWRGMR